MTQLTVNQKAYLTDINTRTRDMLFGQMIYDLIAGLNNRAKSGTPVNAVAASNILTLTDVVIDGETVTIDNPEEDGSDIYEFAADEAQSVAEGNIAVDITAYVTASANTLTVDTQPTSGDTMTLGGKEYTFVPDGTDNADGEITIGTDLATAQAAIVAAVNGTDDHNTANTSVSLGAFAANASIVTALVGGVAGDAIDTTETFTAGTNVFSGATLGSGADCTAANAITALAAAVTASDTQGVGAADGAGDTVDFTADTKGVIGNSIALETDMANATFDTATLEDGVDGTVGEITDRYVDGSYLYILSAANTIADANWLRIAASTY